jgi:osmotically-inducible protein OsmY
MMVRKSGRDRRAAMVLLALLLGVFPAVGGLGGCAAVEGKESGGQYVDDATISTKVRAQLVDDQALKAFDIHVETMNDVVQLSGFVDSAQQKIQAEQIARNVAGVRAVRNNIVARSQ